MHKVQTMGPKGQSMKRVHMMEHRVQMVQRMGEKGIKGVKD